MMRNKILVAILLVAIALRLPGLTGSFWLDEAAQALESARPFREQHLIAHDFQPPLYHYLVHFMMYVSRAEWWLRLASLIPGIATIGLVYMLVDAKIGRRSALFATLLLATSPFHVYFSQELRPYALAAFFATLSWTILLTKIFEKRRWTWFTLVTVLGMYTMYLYPFVVLSQCCYLFREQRQKFSSFCFSLVASGLFFFPWVPSFWEQLQIGTDLTLALPGWAQTVATPQLKALPLTFAKFFVGQVALPGSIPLVVATLLALCVLGVGTIVAWRDQARRAFVYWAFVPLLAAWIVSFVIPVIQPKRVMLCLPAVLILLIPRSKRLATVVVTGILLLQFSALTQYFLDPQLQREDWRGVIRSITTTAPAGSVALFAFPEAFAPWRWYSDGTVRALPTASLVTDAHVLAAVSGQLQGVSRVYSFEYLTDLTDPTGRIEEMLATQAFGVVDTIDGRALGFVRVFARME